LETHLKKLTAVLRDLLEDGEHPAKEPEPAPPPRNEPPAALLEQPLPQPAAPQTPPEADYGSWVRAGIWILGAALVLALLLLTFRQQPEEAAGRARPDERRASR